MVGTLETIFLQRPAAPWMTWTVRLTALLVRVSSINLAWPAPRQPSTLWSPHALRGVQNPRLMYCRLRATAHSGAQLSA